MKCNEKLNVKCNDKKYYKWNAMKNENAKCNDKKYYKWNAVVRSIKWKWMS